ncbi:Conidiation protein 6-domain-containing protein [Tricharina praecox]|uniref:Conidiation protein 6-domain-containing protein n=1 Tax=Tricharina praecox TaxID=43433 RepID=UPI00221E8FA8|nr:Conidiation protein 6-domain-containing protein [Tricharina praecox]KAI5844085.1 Conidiation protein 6-domain-containing protein [Tricharina praecox]
MDTSDSINQRSTGNVIGGHKANLKNPNTSEEAKEHSRQVLDELGSETKSSAGGSGDDGSKNTGNVIGGYKATLKNPNVSDEAKGRAEQKLEQMGAK